MADFSLEIKGIDKALEICSARMVRAALNSALKRTIGSAKTAIDEKIREGYNIKKSDISKAMKVKPVTEGLIGTIVVTDADKRGIPIFQMAGRIAVQTREGTWIEVRKGKVQVISQAFIQSMKSAHKGVFIRYKGGSGKGGRLTSKDVGRRHRVDKGHNWIHEIYGPRITSLAGDAVIRETVQNKVNEVAQANFDHEIDARIKGYVK